jgi:hypothetical protein
MDKTTANSAVQYHWVLGATGFVGRNLIQENMRLIIFYLDSEINPKRANQ